MSRLLPLDLFIRQALLYPLDSPFLPPENKVEKDFSYAAGKKIGTLEVEAPAGLPKTGQTIKYEDNDDGDLERGLPLIGARFIDNEDGTITDVATGLMWIGNLVDAGMDNLYNFIDAIAACVGLTYAGHNDWRFPNFFELVSLVNYGRHTPTIDPIFVTCRNTYYSSSTTAHSATVNTWYVNFEYGFVGYRAKVWLHYIRPVRLGPA